MHDLPGQMLKNLIRVFLQDPEITRYVRNVKKSCRILARFLTKILHDISSRELPKFKHEIFVRIDMSIHTFHNLFAINFSV